MDALSCAVLCCCVLAISNRSARPARVHLMPAHTGLHAPPSHLSSALLLLPLLPSLDAATPADKKQQSQHVGAL
jgi:hypothetical protein